jgi:hypothetical protein
MVLHFRLSSDGRQRRINTKKGPLVHQKQLRKKKEGNGEGGDGIAGEVFSPG